MIRAFLGLDLPEGIRSALAVQQFLLPLPRRVDPAQMHLTLVFLGEIADPVLEAAHEGFARLAPAVFPLELRGLGLFGGDRPRQVWAGAAPSAPLAALHERAAHAARQAGCTVPARRFVPHVTLGRFAPPPADQAMRLERAVAQGAAFHAGPWPVRGMVLWESRLVRGGSHYIQLARYPFRDGTVS